MTDSIRIIAAPIQVTAWTEIAMGNLCDFGCKIHARINDGMTEVAVLHMATYGCQLGRDETTATAYLAMTDLAADARAAANRVFDAYFAVDDEDRAAYDRDQAEQWASVAEGEKFDADTAAMNAAEWANDPDYLLAAGRY
jgi:hypothetical protein